MSFRILITPFIFLIAVFGCTPLPEAAYYSVEGVVSIEAESHQKYNNWIESHYYTSMGMTSVKDTTATGGSLDFRFYITEPGSYAIWVLSRKYSEVPDENKIQRGPG